MIFPADFMQAVLVQVLGDYAEANPDVVVTAGNVVSEVPPGQVPDPFIMHTVTSSDPVGRGPATLGNDSTLTVSVSSQEPLVARELASNILDALQGAYDSDAQYAGQRLAYFEVQMLPLRQPVSDTAVTPQRKQWDAVYRLIVTN